jgi:hypothetical protein
MNIKQEVNGWTDEDPRGPGAGGRYGAYNNQFVVIFSNTKSKFIYLPRAVLEALGNPTYIKVRSRGSNIGFFKWETTDGAFKVQRSHKGMIPYISLTALVKRWNIKPGVYEAHIESGGVVFDTRQQPSMPA